MFKNTRMRRLYFKAFSSVIYSWIQSEKDRRPDSGNQRTDSLCRSVSLHPLSPQRIPEILCKAFIPASARERPGSVWWDSSVFQENELRSLISYRNDVKTAAINVKWIFSEDRVRRQELQRDLSLVSHKIDLPPKKDAAFDSNRLSINHSENSRKMENPAPAERHKRAAEKRHYEPSL